MQKAILILLFMVLSVGNFLYGQQPYVIKKDLKITSSEYLLEDPAQEKKYPLKNIMDNDLQTAWVYEQVDLDNKSVGFRIEFTERKLVDGILFSNGYLKSEKLYKTNNRTKGLRIKTSEGLDKVYYFSDDFEIQKASLPKQRISWIDIEIVEYTPGDVYQDHCVSEFHLTLGDKKVNDNSSAFLIENTAGMYSSDKITFYPAGTKMDLSNLESYLGLTNPRLSPDQRFALYNPGEDFCYYEIVDLESGKLLKLDLETRYCPQEWISSADLKMIQGYLGPSLYQLDKK